MPLNRNAGWRTDIGPQWRIKEYFICHPQRSTRFSELTIQLLGQWSRDSAWDSVQRTAMDCYFNNDSYVSVLTTLYFPTALLNSARFSNCLIMPRNKALLWGTCHMPPINLVAYTHFQEVGARAYIHLYFCGRKCLYLPSFLAIHHCLGVRQ